MKKLIPVILCCVLLFNSIGMASASEVTLDTYRTSDGVLVDSSVDTELATDIPDEILDVLQDYHDPILVSASVTFTDFETNSQTRASMPTSDFSLSVYAFELGALDKANDGVHGDAFLFLAMGRWYVDPFYEFTDCMGITWSDDFTLYHTSGYVRTNLSEDGSEYVDRRDTMTLKTISPEQGFAYNVDLLVNTREDSIVLMGKVYKADSTGSANVCASYGHVIVTAGNVSVTFAEGEPLGMTVPFTSAIESAIPSYDYFNY